MPGRGFECSRNAKLLAATWMHALGRHLFDIWVTPPVIIKKKKKSSEFKTIVATAMVLAGLGNLPCFAANAPTTTRLIARFIMELMIGFINCLLNQLLGIRQRTMLMRLTLLPAMLVPAIEVI
ncbi:hypothetical protein F5Y16DRAFT_375775 [Xylariaceae sp. FL0255]|nr:hypothetical protein F5Y16DRAFT_375775 [Xylariaceae sp. FL0255]